MHKTSKKICWKSMTNNKNQHLYKCYVLGTVLSAL